VCSWEVLHFGKVKKGLSRGQGRKSRAAGIPGLARMSHLMYVGDPMQGERQLQLYPKLDSKKGREACLNNIYKRCMPE
jgi:hypothetical protein